MMKQWMRFLMVVVVGVAGLGVASGQTLATGDSRTVTEPVFPPVCTTLDSQMAIVSGAPASETAFDTARIQAALTACASGSAVELAVSGSNAAFLIQPINIPTGVGLIVDGGVTVFASRNPADYQTASTELCGSYGASGNGCNVLIKIGNGSTNVGSGIYGYGVIDGRGGSTMLGGPNPGITWWANADNAGTANETQDNFVMMNVSKSTNFTLYKITLRNSPEFHVVWSGNGLTAWGVKIATPFTAHNTDGIDPSGSNVTVNLSSISDGDDNFAINASSAGANMTVENTTTYSGHGISIGSYTQGGFTNLLVNNVNMAGTATDGNATGIRLKSAQDRGGLLKTITYENMCLKDMRHILQFTPFYDTNTGTLYPSFQNIVLQDLHFLTPTGTQYPYLVQMEGFSANYISTITMNNVVFDQLLASNVTPASQYDAFTLAGNVYPAFLQSLPGTGVTYTGTATSTAGTGVSACTGVFPYLNGELYLSTATATSLKTVTIASNATVTLNAMVEPAMSQVTYAGTAGTWTGAAAPTAQVQFYEGATLKGSATIAGNGTIAPLTLSGVTAGTHTYTATYPGDANYAALTFGSVTVTVSSATVATTTVLTAPTTAAYGASTTLSATVTGTGGTPTGSVAFYDGATSLGSAALVSGKATLGAVVFGGGSHTLTAVYSADNTYLASTSTVTTLLVSLGASGTTVTATPSTVSQNTTTVLKATVTGVAGGATPSGTVSFTDGVTSLGNATLASGVATLTATMVNAGARTVTAAYNGDTNYTTSSGTAAVTVATTTSTTVLTAPATAVYGTAITLSAKVTVSSGTPTGSVSFYDGTTLLGSGTLASQAASLTGVLLLGGAHSLTALYSGDTVFPASTSAVSALTVTLASTSTGLTIAPTTTVALTPVGLTATVNVSGSGILPSGTVTFSDGSTVLGTGTLLGTNIATLAAPLPNVGTRTITAAYGGDTNYAVSSGTASEVVTAVATSVVLTLSSATTYGGGTVTMTATVTPATGGTVTFYANGTSVGTGTVGATGMATYAFVPVVGTVGMESMTAVYGASSPFGASSSNAVVLTVGTAVILSSSVSTLAVPAGGSGTLTLSALPGGGFTGPVALTCSTPVAYVTCTVASSSLTVSGTTAVTSGATINVAATTSSMRGLGGVIVLALLAPFGLLARRRTLRALVAAVMLLVGAMAMSGCGGSSPASATTSNKPAGSLLVSFTAAAAGASQTVQVVVNIQ